MQIVCVLSARKRRPLTKTLRIMNLTAILLFVACLTAGAKSFSQISISEKNAPLEKVFAQIERQTSYTFVYTDKVLQDAKPVTVEVSNVSLEQVLSICFKEQPYTYTISDK